jgi:6-phosphogluconate dehydrogenase
VRQAFQERQDLTNLLLDADIGSRLEIAQTGLRRALTEAVRRGLPAPCWSAALAYIDAFRSARLPQNLTQAQRDYFGAHTYRRLDAPDGPAAHTDWQPLGDAREVAR